MNLKEFNIENCKPSRGLKTSPPAAVSMSTDKGLFILNKEAVALIGLSDKIMVVVHQDEDNPEDWYLELVKEKGFLIRVCRKWSQCKFNNVKVARKIAESVGFKGKTGRMLIAGQPTEIGNRTLWGILAINLKNI
jgi:hypothetical protein